jgi:hypothetical protein
VRHGQDVNLRSARHCRRRDDYRAWPVLPAFVLASIKLSSPQEGVPKDKARRGLREPHPNRREGRSGDRAQLKPGPR